MTDPAPRRRKKGGAVVLVAVLAAGAAVAWVVWERGGDEARIPTAHDVTRPTGTQYVVSAEPLRTSRGFEVVDLGADDLRAEPRLADLLDGSGRATVLLSASEHARLREHLAARLPPGWDDPFAYGVAWRHGNVLVRLASAPASGL